MGRGTSGRKNGSTGERVEERKLKKMERREDRCGKVRTRGRVIERKR